MKKVLLTSILILLTGLFVQAQQDARYTQYMFNKLAINPAYAGSTNGISATAIYRTQWVNIDGAPQTMGLSAHSPLGAAKKIGIGGSLEYDKIGVHDKISAFATYSYSFPVRGAKFALGVQGGITHLSSNYTSVGSGVPDPTLFNPNDPLFQQNESRLLPNFGVGIYYYNPSKFYVGASIPHLLSNNLRTSEGPNIVKSSHLERHYYLMAGAVFGHAFKIKPSVLIKMVPNKAPIQFDANLMFLIKNMVWIGSSFRTDEGLNPESVDFIVAFQLPKGMKIGYAYDYTLSPLSNYTTGSHEVVVSYDFVGKVERIKTPRYF